MRFEWLADKYFSNRSSDFQTNQALDGVISDTGNWPVSSELTCIMDQLISEESEHSDA